jgi:hypothetical protein
LCVSIWLLKDGVYEQLDILIAITARKWYHTAPEAYQAIIVGSYVYNQNQNRSILSAKLCAAQPTDDFAT